METLFKYSIDLLNNCNYSNELFKYKIYSIKLQLCPFVVFTYFRSLVKVKVIWDVDMSIVKIVSTNLTASASADDSSEHSMHAKRCKIFYIQLNGHHVEFVLQFIQPRYHLKNDLHTICFSYDFFQTLYK